MNYSEIAIKGAYSWGFEYVSWKHIEDLCAYLKKIENRGTLTVSHLNEAGVTYQRARGKRFKRI